MNLMPIWLVMTIISHQECNFSNMNLLKGTIYDFKANKQKMILKFLDCFQHLSKTTHSCQNFWRTKLNPVFWCSDKFNDNFSQSHFEKILISYTGIRTKFFKLWCVIHWTLAEKSPSCSQPKLNNQFFKKDKHCECVVLTKIIMQVPLSTFLEDNGLAKIFQ